MVGFIRDIVIEEDVRCPMCGAKMKIIGNKKGKSKFKCINCGYKIN